MKRCLKKSLALLLTLLIALSALSCLAMAEGEGSDDSKVTIYITCDAKDLRPGDTVDIDFTIGPVENLTRFEFKAAIPDGLTFDSIRRHNGMIESLDDIMFNGNGEVTRSSDGTQIQGYAYPGCGYTSSDELYMFSARYYVPSGMEAGEVTFSLESASVILGGSTAEVVWEPLQMQIIVLDTTELEAQVRVADIYVNNMRDDYSEYSISVLEKALNDAQEILENIHDYYQADVDQALAALTAAIDGLKSPRGELTAAIETAEQLRESDYTTDSWGNLADALTAAKEIRDKDDATEEELNGAADALYEAIDALVPVDDPLTASREALEQLVQEVRALNQGDYSESAWASLQTALENAEKVLSDENASKEELDEAYDVLALALARADLEKDIESARQLDSSNYTSDSWAALQDAIANAEEVLNNENATLAELKDADDALIAALNGLETANGQGTSSGGGGGTTTGGVTSPQTGDSNLLLMCMIVLAAGMGACAAVCVSKACGRKE